MWNIESIGGRFFSLSCSDYNMDSVSILKNLLDVTGLVVLDYTVIGTESSFGFMEANTGFSPINMDRSIIEVLSELKDTYDEMSDSEDMSNVKFNIDILCYKG